MEWIILEPAMLSGARIQLGRYVIEIVLQLLTNTYVESCHLAELTTVLRRKIVLKKKQLVQGSSNSDTATSTYLLAIMDSSKQPVKLAKVTKVLG